MGEAAHASAAIGVEIADSATRLTAAISGAPGARRHARLTAPPSPEEALAQLTSLVAGLIDAGGTHELGGIGVALWGRVDASAGTVLDLPLNPDWGAFPLGMRLAERFRVPVRVVRAVEAAARAEAATLGEAHTVLYCHAGRAIQSCAIRGGQTLRGAHGREGQLGHLAVVEGGTRCSCGQYGHLEALGSAQGIVRTFIGRASATEESEAAMHRASGGRAEAITVSQIAALAATGEPAARDVLDAAAMGWAAALAVAQTLYDVDTVIIGGPLAAAGDTFLARVASLLAAKLPSVTLTPRLVYGAHPFDGALVGACLLAAASGS